MKFLFLFNCKNDNREAYVYAVEEAINKNAELILFTTVEDLNNNNLDEVYLHLLVLRGHYLKLNHWKDNPDLKVRKIIECGSLPLRAIKFIRQQSEDLHIIGPAYP